MSLGNDDKPKVENIYRMFFRKVIKTRKYPDGKIVYKDFFAFSHEEAEKLAREFIEKKKGKLKILQSKSKK